MAQFKAIRNEKSVFLFENVDTDLYFIAWTTTPWTLPSNTALCVGPKITYLKVRTFNPYTGEPVTVILAKNLFAAHFDPKNESLALEDYYPGDKKIPYVELGQYSGTELQGVNYEQLINWVKPKGDAFRVITGDFVTTEDGTGIVHIAPTFGADDDRVAKQHGISPLIVDDLEGKRQPLVDRNGRFFLIENMDPAFVAENVNLKTYPEFAGRFVKNAYDENLTEEDSTVDIDICVMLKKENKAFKVEKHVHSYPHCWRTDKPILYYPLDSWFIRTTAVKDKMIALNNTINWKPQSTGTGRFGNWLENLVDWNLSRSRFWGTPLPLWRTEDGLETKCIGSVEELMSEIDTAVSSGVMEKNIYKDFEIGNNSKENYEKIDLHRPFVDDIFLVSTSGKKMYREPDLIDVWFDSGAMPYAQHHYPFGLPPTPSTRGGVSTPWNMADPISYEFLKEKSKQLRKFSTQAESYLWDTLRGKRLESFKFRRQHVIDQFIADFVCLSKKLIIEVDGPIHTLPENQISDAERSERLKTLGYRILRFSNDEVLTNIENVLAKIETELNATLKPSPAGRVWEGLFPADFIAEGVDQTRGWFFTLHAIATMIDGSVAFKNIISNGLVLDKSGNKMSKRLGNAVDPFAAIEENGSDPLRWYMLTNSQPWDNLKFDISGVDEVKRKFFGTLYNTYNFFAMYANIDGFTYSEDQIPVEERPELDRWIISLLNSLIKEVGECYENYEPTRAGRSISEFVSENLSNWFVRLSRKRFWGGSYDKDKISAYQTLYTCLKTVAKLSAPIAPFYSDLLFTDLNKISGKEQDQSVHLSDFPGYDESLIDSDLEQKMAIAQKASSMILSLRRKEKLKVRQPLAKIMVPVLNNDFQQQFDSVKNIILSEVNVKEVEYLTETSGIISKKIKANFKTLGPKYGKLMKQISVEIAGFSQEHISLFEKSGNHELNINGEPVSLSLEDVEIQTEDIPGWLVASEGDLTIALDINLTEELKQEGIAREFINKIQNIRKESDFELTDRIVLRIQKHDFYNLAVEKFKDFISNQTLASELVMADQLEEENSHLVDIDTDVEARIQVIRNS